MAVSVTISFTPGPEIGVDIDDPSIARWIDARLNDARNHFVRSVSAGLPNPSPAGPPKHWPRTDTGRLVNSVHAVMLNPRHGSLRSDIEYAEYLSRGTDRMAPRKMLVEALTEVLEARPETDELAKAARLSLTEHIAPTRGRP